MNDAVAKRAIHVQIAIFSLQSYEELSKLHKLLIRKSCVSFLPLPVVSLTSFSETAYKWFNPTDNSLKFRIWTESNQNTFGVKQDAQTGLNAGQERLHLSVAANAVCVVSGSDTYARQSRHVCTPIAAMKKQG